MTEALCQFGRLVDSVSVGPFPYSSVTYSSWELRSEYGMYLVVRTEELQGINAVRLRLSSPASGKLSLDSVVVLLEL